MGKKSQTESRNNQSKKPLTAGRIIKLRLPTDTDKPNPFLTGLNKPDKQEPVTPGVVSQGTDTSGGTDAAKPTEPEK